MKKKLLALLLASSMVAAMAACGNDDSGSSSGDNSSTPSTPSSQDDGSSAAGNENEEPGATYVGPDWEAVSAMDYDDASDYFYDWNLGEYYEYYSTAKAEYANTDLRLALMAIAEAKLMESGMFIPTTGNGGSYAMSRVVPRSVTTADWGLDNYRNTSIIVCNELLRAEDRTALVALWGEVDTADEYFVAIAAYLLESGYTLTDTYNYNAGTYEIVTWDVIASSYTGDGLFIAPTYSPLLEYDVKNAQQPALATGYEVSADGLTYTFHIREGVKWVDNQGREYEEVTADDWVASMQHLADNNDALGWLMSADGGCGIKNYDAYINGEVSFDEVGVKALDKYTLEYTLEVPFPAFTTMLGYGCFAPLNRSFYKSRGGTFSAEGDEYTAGTYGTSPENILYCGAYLVTNYTNKNICTYVANPSYWNPDAVITPNMNYHYNSGEDVLRVYNETKAGTFSAGGLNSNALVLAQEEIPEGETGTYFDTYVYTTTNDSTAYGGWMNVNRGTFTNYNDSSMGVSPKANDEEAQARTQAAINNQNFRLAVAFGFDRAGYNAQSVGEELKYVSLKNNYVTGSFAFLLNDTTVEINGQQVTFPAGTYYGAIQQAQLDADGYPITVWDPNADDGVGSSDGFDGWYNVNNAREYLQKAIDELAQVGVEVSASNPIYLDYPYGEYSEVLTNSANAVKQSIEASLEGKVIINLVGLPDSTSRQAADYRFSAGNEANFDFSLGSGWGPDYQDPQTFLDTVQPYGYMTKNFGIY